MFMGEYHQKIDEKGRITIPAKFRQGLGDNFIVTRGLDGCLFAYPMDTWNIITKKYENLPNVREARNFMRFLFSGANDQSFDKNGRINVSALLLKYAHLGKECVVIGVGDRIEIWDADSWNDFTLENESAFSEMADKLFSNQD